ncbi:hypothetical protein APHAL10511_000385 [Amanita phalloides]|nr:hypothetical protein APHAL10511_000385 [Amanita phalloides]
MRSSLFLPLENWLSDFPDEYMKHDSASVERCASLQPELLSTNGWTFKSHSNIALQSDMSGGLFSDKGANIIFESTGASPLSSVPPQYSNPAPCGDSDFGAFSLSSPALPSEMCFMVQEKSRISPWNYQASLTPCPNATAMPRRVLLHTTVPYAINENT